MNRLRIEVLRFLEARDLLLGIGVSTRAWQESSLADELWTELLLADFGSHPRANPRALYKAKWISRKRVAQIRKTEVRIIHTGTLMLTGSIANSLFPYSDNALPGFCYLKLEALIVTGGKDDRASYSVAQVFHLALGTQASLPNMLCERYAHGVVRVRDYVYCFGGGGDPLFGRAESTAERFCLTKQSWSALPEMPTHRMMFSPCKRGLSIFLVGGCWTNKCEVFNVESCIYTPLPFKSPVKGPCCCVKLTDEILMLSAEEVWVCRSDNEKPKLLARNTDCDLDLPYFFAAAVHVKEFVFLHGNDQSLFTFSLRTKEMLKVADPLGEMEDEGEQFLNSRNTKLKKHIFTT